MATPTLYDTTSKIVSLTPDEGESEQDFLMRVKRKLDSLEEDEFNGLPSEVQDWSNDAANAVQNKQPIQALTGSPFVNGEDTAEPKAAAGKGGTKAGTKAGKAAAKATSGGKGKAAAKEPATKKAAAAPKAAKVTAPKKEPKPRGDGVLKYLMQEAHADPKATAAVLKERVEAKHKGLEVKIANAIGIRQQYRRFATFFNEAGAFKKNIEL